LKAKAAGFPKVFVQNRQDALDKHSSTDEGAKFTSFYSAKKEANGGLLALYSGTAPAPAVEGFVKQSNEVWSNITRLIVTDLPGVLPSSGFIGGERPGETDFHVGAWLSRIAMTQSADDVKGLEESLGAPVPEKVVAYWNAWAARPSWKKVYAEGLH
jgi:hypothetical protein